MLQIISKIVQVPCHSTEEQVVTSVRCQERVHIGDAFDFFFLSFK